LIPTIYIQCVAQPKYVCSLIGIKTSIYWGLIRKYWLFASVILFIRIFLIDTQITESFFNLIILGIIYLLIFLLLTFYFIVSPELILDLQTRFPKVTKRLMRFKQRCR
jgi:hypothetical protein